MAVLLGGGRCCCCLLKSSKVPKIRPVRVGYPGRGEKDERDSSQVRRAPLFGLVVIGAGDAKSDTMLAGSLGIIWILARAPHLARTTRVAA